MVNRRRHLKSGPAALKTEPRCVTPIRERRTLRMVINNPNPLQRELSLLCLESSYLSTAKIPLLTVDSSNTSVSKCKCPADLQLASNSKNTFIHLLPLSQSIAKSGPTTLQHYLYIPNISSSRPQNTIISQNAQEPPDTKTEIALEAKLEASVLQQINKLAKQGLWSATRLPKVMEPRRSISHWDCLLDEARWMAIDFLEERKWKMEVAKTLAHAAQMFCLLKEEILRRDRGAYEEIRCKNASLVAAMVRSWWSGVSDSVNDMCLLGTQRRWRSTVHQTQSLVTQLTDVGPNWIGNAVSQSPGAVDIFKNLTDDAETDWLPPSALESSGSSTMSSSFESLIDLDSSASSQYSRESSSWGLMPLRFSSTSLMPPPQTLDSDNQSIDSSVSVGSSVATENEDLVGLLLDSELCLGDILEPYMSNGWTPHSYLGSRDAGNFDEDCAYDATFSQQTLVNVLRQDALLPVRQLLPPGYQPISGSYFLMNGGDSPPKRRQSTRRISRPPLHNGGSLGITQMCVDEDSSETSDGSDSETWPVMSQLHGTVLQGGKNETLICLTPGEMARRARGIIHLKKQFSTNLTKRALHSLIPAYGPTCRVPFLSTSSMHSAVAWLLAAHAQHTSACLVPPGPVSGDSELCLVVHLGQLSNPPSPSAATPDWGPHLIVCPRVLLAAWRSRLASVCPGLRCAVVGVGSNSGAGRRLKKAVAQGQVHVCLTTYAALRSKPHRFTSIHWSVVTMDQVHHLVFPNHEHSNNENARPSNVEKQQQQYESGVSGGGDDANNEHSVGGNVFAQDSEDVNKLDNSILLSSLGSLRSKQRICVYAADVGAASIAQLCSLFCLATGCCFENVEMAIRESSAVKPEPGVALSRTDVSRALEPLIYRFEEEDDYESYVQERTISNCLTAYQRNLHDQICIDKTCERAVKSGHLTDLLTCVSAGARVCVHPWLFHHNPRAVSSLYGDCQPAPSPPSLVFQELPDVLAEVTRLRFERERVLPQPLLLRTTQATYVQRRLVELLPTKQQLMTVFGNVKPVLANGVHLSPTKKPNLKESVFIDEEAFFTVLLDESASLSMAKGASTTAASIPATKVNQPPPALNVSRRSHLSANAGGTDTQDPAPSSASESAIDSKKRLDQLERQASLLRLAGNVTPDWCCDPTVDFVRAISASRSLIPVYPSSRRRPSTESSLSHLWSVVTDHFAQLPPPSSPFGVYCTRDRAIGYPPMISETAEELSEDMKGICDCLRHLMPLSRWISPSCLPHNLPNFLAESGKIQCLRNLIREFVGSSKSEPRRRLSGFIRRPRAIFVISHQSAMLDILEAWLPCDPFLSSLCVHRVPIDHLDGQKEGGRDAVDYINIWPMAGLRGPLVVLMHARSPAFSLAGLRAGPDTRVIICDADWRVDVVDSLKAKLRCWALNGLVDVPISPSSPNCPSFKHHHHLPVYRLVTEAETTDSIEARLVISPAVRLLPDSVFMTASPTVATVSAVPTAKKPRRPAQPPRSRVQPNVVQELVARLRRAAVWRRNGMALPQPPSSSVMESDFEEETTADDESDTASLFHNREPLDETALYQTFELYEAPRDVQAWCSSLAEAASIPAEIHPGTDLLFLDAPLPPSYPSPHESLADFDPSLMASVSSLAFCDGFSESVDGEALKSRFEAWELDKAGWREAEESFVALTSEDFGEPLSYLPWNTNENDTCKAIMEQKDGGLLFPLTDINETPIWLPMQMNHLFPPLLTPIRSDSPVLPIASNTPWGYATEPMVESELPPMASLAPTFTPVISSTLLPPPPTRSGCTSGNMTPIKTPTFTLKRSAVSARLSSPGGGGVLSQVASSVASSGGAPLLKKRKLTGAAAMAARRAANAKAAAATARSQFEIDTPNTASSNQSSFLLSSFGSIGGSSSVSNTPAASCASTGQTPFFTVYLSPHQKTAVPRPFFFRDMRGSSDVTASASLASNPGTASGSLNPATSSILRVAFGGSGPGARGMAAALNNPLMPTKYAVPTGSGGRQNLSVATARQPNLHASSSGLVAFKFGGTTPSGSAGSLSEGKPPDWTPYEEAGLLQCTTKLQNIPYNANSAIGAGDGRTEFAEIAVAINATATPNFRLAEFYLNNFFLTLSYRSSRQCLLAYYRSMSAISAAGSFCAPNDGIKSGGSNGVNLFGVEGDKLGCHGYHHQQLQYHPQQQQNHASSAVVGRKVKNKQKANMCASLLPTASANLLGLNTTPTSGSPRQVEDTTNRLKGYQAYHYLQSLHNNPSSLLKSTAGVVQPPPPLMASSPLEQHLGLLRKFVCEATSTATAPFPTPHPTTTATSSMPVSASSLHHQLHLHRNTSSLTFGLSSTSVSTTTAAMLMRANTMAAAATAAASASSGSSLGSVAMPSGAPSGPVIHKNPTHIAALQEHNISPDTLITPAMVIKNKEEREARQRAEATAMAANALTASSLASSGPTSSSAQPPSVGRVQSGSSQAPHHLQQHTAHHGHSTPIGGGSAGGGVTTGGLQRSSSLLPFSSTGSSFGSGSPVTGTGAPTVFRYTTTGANQPSQRPVTSSYSSVGSISGAGGGILRRVSSGTSSHLQASGSPRYTVTTASGAGGTQRLVATGPGAVSVVCSGNQVISTTPTLVRRGVTLTTGQGGPLAAGMCFTTTTQAAGVTVLAAGGTRPGTVLYQSGTGTSVPQSTGITFLPTGSGAMAQIIRPRQPIRSATSFPPQKFVRTLSTNPATMAATPGTVIGIQGTTHHARKEPVSGVGAGVFQPRGMPQQLRSGAPLEFGGGDGSQQQRGVSDPQFLSRIHSVAARTSGAGGTAIRRPPPPSSQPTSATVRNQINHQQQKQFRPPS